MEDDELVDALRELDDGRLTGWELEFVEDLLERWEDGETSLTDKQRDKAKQIIEERG